MRLLTFKLPQSFNLFCFGDDHEGAMARSTDGWNKLIEMMNTDYKGVSRNVGWDHGDPIEAIAIDDPRYYAPVTKEASILAQINEAVRNRWQIRKKILGMNESNHPLKQWRFGHITQEICNRLGIEYGTWSTKISYCDTKDRLMFKHFATHGRKSIGSVADDVERQNANMRIQLKRHLYRKAGDVLLMSKGHTHKLLLRSPDKSLYLTDDGKKLKQRYTEPGMERNGFVHPDSRWYLNTGSFLRTFVMDSQTYSEQAEYDPTELGFWIVCVRNRTIDSVDKVTV